MKVEVDDPSMGTFKSHKILSHYRPDSYLDPHYRPQMHGDTNLKIKYFVGSFRLYRK